MLTLTQKQLLGLLICVHNYCCTQYCTEQTWQFSLLPSRQSRLLNAPICLSERREAKGRRYSSTMRQRLTIVIPSPELRQLAL